MFRAKYQILGLGVIVLLLLLSPAGCRKKQKLNLLLITVDTLRADHLSCYGYHRKTSPTFDQVAGQGARFTNVVAQRGLTWPSITSIQTSLYPSFHGVRNNGMAMDTSQLTLAQLLQRNGYKTAAFLTNMTSAKHPGFKVRFTPHKQHGRDERVADKAIEWLNKNGKEPFYVWIHFLAPHNPYEPPAAFRKFAPISDTEVAQINNGLNDVILNKVPLTKEQQEAIVSLYDGEILFVDAQIKRVADELDRLGLKDNTLFILAADHGEELNQRNNYFYHGCSIYDSVLNIPLIIRLPGVIVEKKVIPQVVQEIDIAPTAADLMSIPIPTVFQGKSRKDLLLSGSTQPDPAVAFSEIEDQIFSIRTDHWRYVYNPNSYYPFEAPYRFVRDSRRNGYLIHKEELYDLEADPKELKNVAELHPDIVKDLQGQLLQWAKKQKKYQHTKIGSSEMEELKSLGYIQ